MKSLWAIVFGTVVLCASQAAAITFNFAGGNGTQATSYGFTSGGLNLTVSSALFDAGLNVYETTPLIDRGVVGLGMLNRFRDKGIGIDGWGKFELAVFNFSQDVVINSVTLALMPNKYNLTGTNMSIRIWDGRSGNFSDTGLPYLAASSGTFNNFGALPGDIFGFGANKRKTEFRISSINVSLVANSQRLAQIAAVPLPASLPMLSFAIFAIGWRRRNKTSVR